jgi:hypothetical protein
MSSLSDAIHVVDVALRATTAYDRPDLGARLGHARRRLDADGVRVLVVGEFKQGKSQLINAIVNAPVCPVDDDIATTVPTVVRHAEEPEVTLVREADGGTQRRSAPIDRLADFASDSGNPGNREGLSHVEVGIPRSVLATGLTLVDTPGVGGLGSMHGAATMTALPTADAVLLVSDAAGEYTASELEFLDQARRVCPTVACVLTKTDLYPEWRRIAELNRGHLAAAGVEAELVPVSSTLRLHAVRTDDQELNGESGFPELLGLLRERILASAEQLACRAAAHDVLAVTEQLSTTMGAELAAQQDPARAQAVVAELTRAQQRADQLRERSARWQQTLGDGVADLIADIDYDLRDRMRQIGRDADRELEQADHTAMDDQFAAWLHQRVSAAVSANVVWTIERARWLAGQVADHFGEDGSRILPDLLVVEPASLVGSAPTLDLSGAERLNVGNRLILGMRGGYSGTLMVGMVGTLAGLSMLNPISIVAGLLLGGKTVRDERSRLLQRRQAEAKNAVRRHLDDVIFQMGKESRDMLRGIQRTLRDHFTGHAEQLQRSVNESLAAARDAARAGGGDRERRVLDLKAELDRIAGLERLARDLMPESVVSR